MKTILIAAIIVVLAVLGWNWYESRIGSPAGTSYGTSVRPSSDSGSGANDYDVNSSHTPLVSPNQTYGIRASGSIH